MTSENCAICYEKTSSKPKSCYKSIICLFCSTEFCFKCIDTYLLSQENDPQCPRCTKPWTHEFLRNETTHSFIEKYREHRMNIKFNFEKTSFPLVMHLVEIEKKRRDLNEELLKKKQEKIELLKKLNSTKRDINRIYRQMANNENSVSRNTNTYSRPCNYEGCKGFIDNKYGKCGLCNRVTCLDCGQNKNDEHVCNPDDVSSVIEILKSTKPCPACGTRIYKITGCDHFFCTKPGCETGFSWKTGQRISDNINTNPHFYAFQAASGRGTRREGDFICGGLPNLSSFLHVFTIYGNYDFGLAIYQAFRHNSHFEFNNWRPSRVLDNTDLSVKFILNEISESKYKTELKKRYKKDEKKAAIYPILEMYSHTMTELFIMLSYDYNYNYSYSENEYLLSVEEFNSICKQILFLKEYTNNELAKIRQQFKTTVPFLNEMWYLHTIRINNVEQNNFPTFIPYLPTVQTTTETLV